MSGQLSEDAMFKALLDNKNKPTKQSSPEKKEVKETPREETGSSEDVMFSVLLKNNPVKENKPPAEEPGVPAEEVVEKSTAAEPEEKPQSVPPVETEELQGTEKAAVSHASANTEIDPDLIVNLTASVNMMYGLLRTVIAPVLILILIVGIVTLFKA